MRKKTGKKKVYLAGGLYTKYQQLERTDEATLLRTYGFQVFNPMESKFNDKSTKPTANMIFNGDTDGVMTSDFMLLDIDTAGLGTSVELGMCVGVNAIYDMLEAGMTIQQIKEKIPRKKVLAHTSDIRVKGAGNYEGHKVPWGISQFFIGAVEHVGEVVYDKDEAYASIVKEVLIEEKYNKETDEQRKERSY